MLWICWWIIMNINELSPKEKDKKLSPEKEDKKVFKIAFDLYVYCTEKQANMIFSEIKNYMNKRISYRKTLRLAGGVTDKIYGSKKAKQD